MTTLNELKALNFGPAPRVINMIVATPVDAEIKLAIVIDGQPVNFMISRSAAASAIARIADALSKST